MRKAVIDVGSNSLLLVVGELEEGHLKLLQEKTRVTGLGTGTKATGLLAEGPKTATLLALAELFEMARHEGVDEIRAEATMAVRIAQNQDEFLREAQAQGTPVSVLSGEDEAEWGFRAVAEDPLLAPARRISIIDPGGNSTELVTADRTEGEWLVRFRRSFPVGTLGLRDGPLQEEAPDFSARIAAVREIDTLLGFEYLPGACGASVVLGATGTNLVTIKKRMTEWDPARVHGEVLAFEEVSHAAGWLLGMTDAQRGQVVGLEKGREKTLHIGALILERFMFALHTADVLVSVRGWRHARLEHFLRSQTP